ncbi:hypothetical protein [Thalassospira mesophila]|uniref:Uncharacterized protein n=1 Tax=Thalassospira mesophila TaxID=1293891 RepID=A0A1Y2L552_9PROT|nr:hypothetical protein [Thalassospira mesophila]OSQ40603.1 hypothetical protein TMES_02310 [Thalassospira mesophila]
MAGFWSTLELVFKAVFGGVSSEAALDPLATASQQAPGDVLFVCGIAEFGVGGVEGSEIQSAIIKSLADFSGFDFPAISQHMAMSTDAVDPFHAVRDAQNWAWSAGLRHNCSALLWGDGVAGQNRLDLWLASKQNTYAPHELFISQKYGFSLPLGEDFGQSIKLLLLAASLRLSNDPTRRNLVSAKLAKALEYQQDRARNLDTIDESGDGVALCFATSALALAENGDRGWCQLASEVLEPLVARCFGFDARADRDQLTMMIAGAGHAGVDQLLPEHIALLALYGHLLNWSALGSSASRVSLLAVEIWRILHRRFEFAAGASVAQAVCLTRLGEACCAHARETKDAALAAEAVNHLRGALGASDAKAYPVLYGLTAYHLGDALIAHGELAKTGLLYESIIPFFQATLKVCSRRENPYLWGRAMFALATVQAMQGRDTRDVAILRTAKMNFVQAQQNLEEAGARSAARTAMGGQMRVETLIADITTKEMEASSGVSPSTAKIAG